MQVYRLSLIAPHTTHSHTAHTLTPHTQGVNTSQAQLKYVEMLQECPAFASTFFEAEYVNNDQRFPKDLWLPSTELASRYTREEP